MTQSVIPAQAGIHSDQWIPACAGMTRGTLGGVPSDMADAVELGATLTPIEAELSRGI